MEFQLTSLVDERLIGIGIALGIGFIVGLEREWAEDKPVGLRSFILISALGGVAALLLSETGGWPIAAAMLALGAVLAVREAKREASGITTIVASLVVFLIGAAAVAGFWLHAIVLGGAVTMLLHWKKPLHRWIDMLGSRDLDIVIRFVLITLVILPVLPDRTFGPYNVFNPFEAWLLVVLIVSINLAGFIAFRVIGARAGGWLAGFLGGLVSSTATTISYAGISKRSDQLASVAALVILVASTVVYGRTIVEISVIAPGLVQFIVWPSVLFSAVLLLLAGIVYARVRRNSDSDMPERENPARIRTALTFGALYVVILVAVAAARDFIGDDAIYAVAFVSGLTDTDALTLSMSQLFAREEIGAEAAWRAIFLATLANLLFKIGAASVLGSPALRRRILATGLTGFVLGTGMLAVWP